MTHDLTLSEIHRHHDHLIEEIRAGYVAILAAATDGGSLDNEQARYVSFLESELMPHALTEEKTIYADAAKEPELKALVESMKDEHQRIIELITELKGAPSPVQTIASAAGFITLLEAHFEKENRILLPALNERGLLPD